MTATPPAGETAPPRRLSVVLHPGATIAVMPATATESVARSATRSATRGARRSAPGCPATTSAARP
jgi:hypothetical protein